MADFRYEDLLPVGADETPYRLLSRFPHSRPDDEREVTRSQPCRGRARRRASGRW